MDPVELHSQMTSSYPPGVAERLAECTVGIAGAGGLGTAAAISLARACVGRLIIVDFDEVEAKNMNRQHYFIDQVGRPKVEALRENLERVNPWVEVTVHNVKVMPDNTVELFGEADAVIEAFDRADQKKMLIETVLTLLPDVPVVGGSGLGGYGNNGAMCTRKTGRLHLCGDMETEADEKNPPMAPRVGIVANMQANQVLELLLGGDGKGDRKQ